MTHLAGLMSTKVWLKRGAEVATGLGSRSAAQVSTESSDTTDFKQKLQDASLTDVLVHGYLGIIFGEPGWPYPEVQQIFLKKWMLVSINIRYTVQWCNG